MAQVTLPYTLTPGQPENVTQLTENLNALVAGINSIDTSQIASSVGNFGAWTSYTPTLSGTGGLTVTTGNATATGKYMKIGRTVCFRAQWTFGSTSSFTGTTGGLSGSLPVTAAVAENAGLVATVGDYQTTTYAALPLYADSSTTAFVFAPLVASGSYANQGTFSPTVPMTWATNDLVWWGGVYEAAS